MAPPGHGGNGFKKSSPRFSEADFQVILPILLSISGFLTYFSVRCSNYKEFEKKKWKKINNDGTKLKLKIKNLSIKC